MIMIIPPPMMNTNNTLLMASSGYNDDNDDNNSIKDIIASIIVGVLFLSIVLFISAELTILENRHIAAIFIDKACDYEVKPPYHLRYNKANKMYCIGKDYITGEEQYAKYDPIIHRNNLAWTYGTRTRRITH